MTKNFPRAIVTGGSSGLGAHIVAELRSMGMKVHDWSRETGVDVTNFNSVFDAIMRDLADDVSIANVDILINCAGINRIEWFDRISEADFDLVMATNAKALWMVTAALLDRLRGGTVLNIVSNASHMPMTHSIAYNASKGAAEIMTKQMARELSKTHGLTVFGVSPNRLRDTGMTDYINQRVCELRGWTPEQAAEYQLKALPAGEETSPAALAEFIGFLLSTKERHKYLNGCIMQYGV